MLMQFFMLILPARRSLLFYRSILNVGVFSIGVQYLKKPANCWLLNEI